MKIKKEDNQNKPALTNEQLIALQKIVIPPAIEESFRFVTVEKGLRHRQRGNSSDL